MGQIGLLVRQVSEPHAILTKPNHNTSEFEKIQTPKLLLVHVHQIMETHSTTVAPAIDNL
jgi:hypothetical protein